MRAFLRGKAPLTSCRTYDGAYVLVRVGERAPDNLAPHDAARLLTEGYLERVPTPEGHLKSAVDSLERALITEGHLDERR